MPANKIRKPTILENLIVDGSKLNTGPNSSTPLTGMTVLSQALVPQLEDVRFSAFDLEATDNGDSTGGFYGGAMFKLPATRIVLLGAFLDLTILSVEAGIAADATLAVAVGTAIATDATHTGGQVNIIASAPISLTGGAGAAEFNGIVALTYLDVVSATSVYLNIGIPDADISADAALNATGVFRMVYLDISDGE